jgi:DNA segregation ATPase FtsK/SpoIIIE-like protein
MATCSQTPCSNDFLMNLFQKGRAAGMHVTLSVPSLGSDKRSMIIKSNIPTVICLGK